jgi:NHL repeat
MINPTRRAAKRALVFTLATFASATAFSGIAAATTNPPSITTIAGDGTAGYSGDGGPAVNAEINIPSGIGVDLTGNLYIGDSADNRVRKVVQPTILNQDVISTFAGNGTGGYSGDGGPATSAELKAPTGVAVDSSGDVFIADTGNNVIREVSPSGSITTFAGNGKCTSSLGNAGKAVSASLCAPTGVATDGRGDVFISDTGHNEVRQVTPSGIINSYAGTGTCGSKGDGGKGVMAQVCLPAGLALDGSHDLFIADTGNSKVRKVAENDNISTVAGNGKFGYSGDGGSATKAELAGPTGVSVDTTGDLFISDTLNSRIREVSGGTITTYAGTETRGFSGDGGPATQAKINLPTGSMAMDGQALFFADTGNQRVRGVFTGPPPVLPETNLIILLPIGGGVILAGLGILVIYRRRRTTPAAVA